MQETAAPACKAERIRHRADTLFLLVMGGRVIAMQTGFAMLEAAYARPMNAANIMMKNFMDLLLGTLAFYFIGYTVAFGDSAQIIEENSFDFALWFLQFSYATTAATIDSGALAGRVSFTGYLLLSVFLTGLIYPVCVRWVWGGGWLQEMGYVDFAGSSVVHMVGAMSALASVCICGPRVGRYPEYRAWSGCMRILFAERNDSAFYQLPQLEVEKAVFTPIKPCNNPVQLLFGTFLLLMGFLAFNPASVLATTQNTDLLGARTTVTTLLAASGGAIAATGWAVVAKRALIITVPHLTNSVLGGLVASCACCHVVPPLLSIFVGFGGGLLALATALFMDRCQLDDTVGAVAVHGTPAAWGVICVALFAQPHCQSDIRGLVFGGGEAAWELLGTQVLGLLALGSFAGVSTYFCVLVIDLIGGFRSSRAAELIGMDFTEHLIDDGSLRYDEKRERLKASSPTRDCLVHRVKMTVSPSKPYTMEAEGQEGQEGHQGHGAGAGGQAPAADGGGGGAAAEDGKPTASTTSADCTTSMGIQSAEVVELERQLSDLRQSMARLTDMVSVMARTKRGEMEPNLGLSVVGTNAASGQTGGGRGRQAALQELQRESIGVAGARL